MTRSLVWVAAVALVAAACGDAGGVAPTSTPAQTPATEATTPAPLTTTPGTSTPPAADAAPATTTAPETDPGDTTVPDRTDRTVPEPPKVPETVPPAPPAIVGEVPEALLAPVLADAAARAGVAAGSLVVVRAEAVEWNDGSLGCPRPGEFYTQAIVPGYWVVLDAGGEQLDYRLNDRGQFVLCDPEFAQPPGSGAPSS